jgi:hypothetical protein
MTEQDIENLKLLDVQLECAKQVARWQDNIDDVIELYKSDLTEAQFKTEMEKLMENAGGMFRDLTVFAGMVHAKKYEI